MPPDVLRPEASARPCPGPRGGVAASTNEGAAPRPKERRGPPAWCLDGTPGISDDLGPPGRCRSATRRGTMVVSTRAIATVGLSVLGLALLVAPSLGQPPQDPAVRK